MHDWSSSVKPSKHGTSLIVQEAEPSVCVAAAFQAEKSFSYLHFQVWLIFSGGDTKCVGSFFAEFCEKTLGFSKTCILGLRVL